MQITTPALPENQKSVKNFYVFVKKTFKYKKHIFDIF